MCLHVGSLCPYYNIPLLLGSSNLKLLRDAAMRRAREKALKMPSILWCSFSPVAVMCRLQWAASVKLLKKWRNISVGTSPAAKINQYRCVAFVHWQTVAVTFDAQFRSQGCVNRLSQYDGCILNGVVFVHLQVSMYCQIEHEACMVYDLIEHVVEKLQSCIDM